MLWKEARTKGCRLCNLHVGNKARFSFRKLGYKGQFIYNSEREREREREEGRKGEERESEEETRACTWQGATRFDKRAPEYHQFQRDTRDKTGTVERGVRVCVCVRGVGQKSAVKKHTRRYTTASRRQWPPRGKVSITGGGRDNGHSKKRMFGPHNDGQRNDLSAYMLHTAACYKYPDVCPMDLDGGGRINRLSRENRLPRDENERKCFAAR